MKQEIEYKYYWSEHEREKLEKVREGISKDLTGLWLIGEFGDYFPQVDLTGVDLSDSLLSHLTFEDMSFRGAVLSGVDLNCSKFVRCDFTGAVIITKELDKGVDFIGCDLSDCTIQLDVYSGSCDFDGSILRNSVFANSDIIVAYFGNAKCENTDFTGIKYDLQRAEDLCFNGYNKDPRLIFDNADLTGAKFDGLSLNHAQFENANLTNTSFKNCDLSSEEPIDMAGWSSTWFEYSEATSFKGATLNNTNFDGANLKGVVGL